MSDENSEPLFHPENLPALLTLFFSHHRHLIQLGGMASVALAMSWHLPYENMARKLIILKEFGDSIRFLGKCCDLVTFFLACKELSNAWDGLAAMAITKRCKLHMLT